MEIKRLYQLARKGLREEHLINTVMYQDKKLGDLEYRYICITYDQEKEELEIQ